MAVKIPVSANLNDGEIKSQISQINSQIKELGAAVAQANKQKFEPISLRSKEDLKTFIQQTQQLLKVQTELRNRMKETGQSGKMPLAADWAKMYPDAQQRAKKLQEVLGFYGNDFEDIRPGRRGGGRGGSGGGRHPHRPDHRPPPNTSTRGIINNIAGAGLRAAGPVGGVGANALGTGMRFGIGAGLGAGAVGLLALGVGKAVGSVVGKMPVAEDNEIAYDTLKRTLGDVNVAFSQLKAAVKATGDQHRVTYSEAARLSTMYGRAGNLGAADFLANGGTGLYGEVGAGIGLSRSFGLDPSQGVGMLGTMRGLGITRSETDTRRFAVLIGETITKAGAFAKADEMMEAISSYASTQARQSLSANVRGYSEQLASLVGMRLPGLDVGGSASMLARMNASMAAGGAHGEASQFFTYGLGAKIGLNPYETRLFREAGSAATLSSVFGPGSVAAGFGFKERQGNESYMSMMLRGLREQYAHLGPGVLAEVTANHTGLSMPQAIAAQQMNMEQFGKVEDWLSRSGINLKDVNMEALSAIGQVVNGTKSDRESAAQQLFNRGDISKEDRARLDEAMSVPDDQWQTHTLITLLSKYGQEDTQGKDIRDSKVALDNINTGLAEKLIPYTEDIRAGIASLAGKSPRQLQDEMKRIEIDERYDALIDEEWKKTADLPQNESFWDAFDRESPRNRGREEIRARVRDLEAQRAKELSESASTSTAARPIGGPDHWMVTDAPGAGANAEPYRYYMAPGHGLGPQDGTASDALFRALMQQESGGRQFRRDGSVVTSSAGAIGIAQVMPGTGPEAAKLAGLPWDEDRFYNDEQYNKALGWAYLSKQMRDFGGDPRKALAAYNGGPGRLRGALAEAARDGNPDWLSYMPKETRDYVPSVMGMASTYNTPMPGAGGDGAGGAGGLNITSDPLRVDVRVDGPGMVSAPQQLQTRVGKANPTGAGAY